LTSLTFNQAEDLHLGIFVREHAVAPSALADWGAPQER
jgi:hypothetical protein